MPRQRNKAPRATMSISLPPSLKKWVQKRAAKLERFDSDVVRDALEYYRQFVEEQQVPPITKSGKFEDVEEKR